MTAHRLASLLLLLPILAVSGSLLCSSAYSAAVPSEGRHPVIRVQDDRLTVQLAEVPWGVVLQELQRQTGLSLRLQTRAEGTVTEAFVDLPLEKGLRRLLRHANLAFLYTSTKEGQKSEDRLIQVWILPRREGVPTEVATAPLQPLAAEQGEAMEALDQSQGSPGRESAIQALLDPDASVREDAVDALAELKDEAVVVHLSRVLLEDVNEDVRASAADALWKIANPQAIEALQGALEDASADVRESAVYALEKIGNGPAIDALGWALQDPEEEVREAAQQALARLNARPQS